MRLVMVGISHESAPVELRERLAFNRSECERALASLLALPQVAEALLLSTCNRTELYVRSGEDEESSAVEVAALLVRELIRVKNADGLDAGLFCSRFDDDAIRYLYRVAAGLESMVKGEAQILGQVRDAYRIACGARGCGVVFHKLFHSAFRVGKKARAATGIGVGAVSVSLAAVELADQALGGLSGRRALVIGAGEMAGLAAAHLADRGAPPTITNRTENRARALAEKLGGSVAPFERLTDALVDCDVVIASAAAPHCLITEDMMRDVMARRDGRPVVLIDIAVPRNIEPAVAGIDGVVLHDIDRLREVVDGNVGRRAAEVPKVERIIEKELDEFTRRVRSLKLVPAIKDMISVVESIRRDEIARVAKHFSKEQLEQLEQVTRSIVKKILHHPIMRLREGGGNGGEDAG